MTARELQIRDRLHKDGAREAADFMEAAMNGGDLETARMWMERMYWHVQQRYALRVALQGDAK